MVSLFKLVLLFGFFICTQASAKFEIFLKNFQSQHLKAGRDVYVYVPREFSLHKSYPVVFMHDGQNLFDPSRAFGGRTWNAENSLNHLIESKQIAPLIVVAIDNTADRMQEYIWESQGREYIEFIISELLPLIRNHFSLKPGPENMSLMGSSLGGLISLHAALHRPDIFGSVAALSPSIWWNNKEILSLYENAPKLPQKIYLDMGAREGEKPDDVIKFSLILKSRSHPNYTFWIDEWGGHNEAAWAYRFPFALKYLFPLNESPQM